MTGAAPGTNAAMVETNGSTLTMASTTFSASPAIDFTSVIFFSLAPRIAVTAPAPGRSKRVIENCGIERRHAREQRRATLLNIDGGIAVNVIGDKFAVLVLIRAGPDIRRRHAPVRI